MAPPSSPSGPSLDVAGAVRTAGVVYTAGAAARAAARAAATSADSGAAMKKSADKIGPKKSAAVERRMGPGGMPLNEHFLEASL